MVCLISFIMEIEGRFLQWKDLGFSQWFYNKNCIYSVISYESRVHFIYFKSPWLNLYWAVIFFNRPINPKKQKLLFFRMPAWTEMQLLIKFFKEIWEMICLLQFSCPPSPPLLHSPNITMKTWGIVTLSLTQSTNFIRKSTLANDLVKCWKAHGITISSCFSFPLGFPPAILKQSELAEIQ